MHTPRLCSRERWGGCTAGQWPAAPARNLVVAAAASHAPVPGMHAASWLTQARLPAAVAVQAILGPGTAAPEGFQELYDLLIKVSLLCWQRGAHAAVCCEAGGSLCAE